MYRQRIQAIAREAGFPVASYGSDHLVLTSNIIAELRVRPYFERWQLALQNEWFHIRLEDHSIFMFGEGANPSYSFVHCPLEVPTFREFLSSSGYENVPGARRAHQSDYDEVLATASIRSDITPIRYDYHLNGYRPGVHPAAHIHIGIENEVRISSGLMCPLSFVLFVMRQMYPGSWERLLSRFDFSRLSGLVRGAGRLLPGDYWRSEDEIELHLK